MRIRLVKSIVPFATVTVMFAYAALCGCERKPEVYTTRGKDPEYQKTLRQAHAQQNATAKTRHRIVTQMEELVARARAALPKDATEAQVKAELESHPEKYPGWKALSAALAKANADLEKQMGDARVIVRARILKEANDQKAVAEGRATDKAPVAAK